MELATLLNSDIEMVYAGIILALVRGNLDLECFKLQKTQGIHGWLRTSLGSCVVIKCMSFQRDTVLWKRQQSPSRLIMVFWKPSASESLCALLYEGLVSLQVTYGLCFGNCCFRGWDHGWSSILRTRFCTPRSMLKSMFVAWAPCLARVSGSIPGLLFIFPFSLWSAL